MLTELPFSIEQGPIGFFNGFKLLLGIENSSVYFGNISTPRYFDNVTCGGGGCDSFGIRKLKGWVSISPVKFAETSKIL